MRLGSDKLTHNEWSVLVCLAWHRNEKTGRCYPSQDQIIRETRLKKTSVSEATQSLKAKGFISIHKICSEKNVKVRRNSYTLCLASSRGELPRGELPPDERSRGGLPPDEHKQGTIPNREPTRINSEVSTNRQGNRSSVVTSPTKEQLESVYREFEDNQDCVAKMREIATVCKQTNWLGIGHPIDYIRGVGVKVKEDWNGFVARCDASEQMRREPAYA